MNTNAKLPTRDVTGGLETTSRAVLAADEARLIEAMNALRWERRGWLGRLVRAEQTERLANRGSRHENRLAA